MGKIYSFFHQTCYFVNKNVFWSTYKSNPLSGHYFLQLYTGYNFIRFDFFLKKKRKKRDRNSVNFSSEAIHF